MAFFKSETTQTTQTTFLKDNYAEIIDALKEVFNGTGDTLVHGTLTNQMYVTTNCGDMRILTGDPKYGEPTEDWGPGIQIAINFENIGPRHFFYPEKECTSIKEFLNNCNTDFGMTQIMFGQQTKYLGIKYYDLEKNNLKFQYHPNREAISRPILSLCWNPETLQFDVNNFLLFMNTALVVVGCKEEKYPREATYRGSAPAATTQTPPGKLKVAGINSAVFLKKIEEKAQDKTKSLQP